MNALRRLSLRGALVCALVAAVIAVFRPEPLVDLFVSMTAIDRWHPNWPGTGRATEALASAQVIAQIMAILFGAVVLTGFAFSTGKTGGVLTGDNRLPGVAFARLREGDPDASRPFFRSWETVQREIREALVDGGAEQRIAARAVEGAAKGVGGLRKFSAEQVGDVLVKAAAATGMDLRAPYTFRADYYAMGVDTRALSRFLAAYGYRSVVDSTDGRPDRLYVAYRTEAHQSEADLLTLLLAAARAHFAALTENGLVRPFEPRRDSFDEAVAHLRRTAEILSLRGFNPEPSSDGAVVASPSDLEAWAMERVIETLGHPMPLGSRDGDAQGDGQ